MLECSGQAADDLKSQRLPEPHGALVRADYEVELHGPISPRACMLQRVLAHAPGNSSPRRGRHRHIAAIADVSSPASLVRTHVIRAENDSVLFGHERLLFRG